MGTTHRAAAPQGHGALTRQLLLMVAGSFAFGFALVPLYDVLCDVIGIRVNDRPSAARVADARSLPARNVSLELVSTLAAGSEWEITPLASEVVVQPGRLGEAKFRIRNRAARAASGQAVPSVAPAYSARYLQKTECFCFSPQDFDGGEEREFFVRFIIDPDLPAQVDRMTLAYTMYTVPAQPLPARLAN